jgi:hypothetical protein
MTFGGRKTFSGDANIRLMFVFIIATSYISKVQIHCGMRLPRIAIGTTIISVRESNTSNFDAIQLQGAAIDLGMEHLKKTYGKFFNFSHTYLMDRDRPEVALLTDDVENLLAKFYYQKTEQTEGLSLLSPCQ